jgi:hypothetical protein
MPIKGLLRSGVFSPEEIEVLSTAFEARCATLV